MNNIGCFIIRNEGNGCLTSIFLEHSSERPFTESCIREDPSVSDDPFLGIFRTSWLEPENKTAELHIEKSGMLYHLHWRNISETDWQYRGNAMIFENKLLGSYWEIK